MVLISVSVISEFYCTDVMTPENCRKTTTQLSSLDFFRDGSNGRQAGRSEGRIVVGRNVAFPDSLYVFLSASFVELVPQ